MDIVFVILNYVANNDTMCCIKSIRQHMEKDDKYSIVVVDNGSPEKCYNELEFNISIFEDVKLIKVEENLGFAKGNNIGIKFARENFNPKFIACINSDVMLLHDGLIKILNREYNEKGFSVLGPLVINSNGRCDTNPPVDVYDTVNDLEVLIRRVSKELFYRKTKLYIIHNILRKINFFQKSLKLGNENFLGNQLNVKLHGCALFFSPKFFDKLDGFDESTFLYMEEDFLRYHLRKNKLISEYCSDIIIYHNEHSSTKKTIPNFIEMLNFRDQCALDSAKKLLKLMQNESNIE